MVMRRAARAVVVDPSLALAWVLEDERSERADARLAEWEHARTRRLAPALFASESATAILRAARRGRIDAARAGEYLAAVLAAVTIRAADLALAPRALAIAEIVGAGRAYDGFYAALAERERIDLWTGDERFHRAASPIFPWVHWVGEED